ncbi:MAG: hypothetical protein IJV22_06150 [Bacteroidales bacterium]|nr:hypothetical protein [Bacteroidales bacterium]
MIDIFDAAGNLYRSVLIEDDSYYFREVMGEHQVLLHFGMDEYVSFPVGCFIVYKETTYTLRQPPVVRKMHNRSFDYTLKMCPSEYMLRIKMMRCLYSGESMQALSDGRLVFSLTARAHEHLAMVVANLNQADTGWSVGEIGSDVEDVEKTVSYDRMYLREALEQIASVFATEYVVDSTTKRISLGKYELNRDNPITMSYGRGNGFISGCTRDNENDFPPIDLLYIEGGERNIDATTYGSKTLLFPKSKTVRYDGRYFRWQSGYDARVARSYTTSSDGMYVRSTLRPDSFVEGNFDATEVYPKYIGTVHAVEVVDARTNLINIYDSSTEFPGDPADTDSFARLGIGGEKPTIFFQSGSLAGREFDLAATDTRINTSYDSRGWKLEIVPAELDGVWMPGGDTEQSDGTYAVNPAYMPQVGDTYVIYGIALPQTYIRNDREETGAEWDALRAAIVSLYKQEEYTYRFSGTVDGIWSKSHWDTVGVYMSVGQHVLFSDDFMPEGLLMRVVGIREYLCKPYSPELTLSNALVRTGLLTEWKGKYGRGTLIRKQLDDAVLQSNSRLDRRVAYDDVVITDEQIRVGSQHADLVPINDFREAKMQIEKVSTVVQMTTEEWAKAGNADKVYKAGTILLDKDTQYVKIADGITTAKELEYCDVPIATDVIKMAEQIMSLQEQTDTIQEDVNGLMQRGGVQYYDNRWEFPAIGQANYYYYDREEGVNYAWNDESLTYDKTGIDIEDIEFIDSNF